MHLGATEGSFKTLPESLKEIRVGGFGSLQGFIRTRLVQLPFAREETENTETQRAREKWREVTTGEWGLARGGSGDGRGAQGQWWPVRKTRWETERVEIETRELRSWQQEEGERQNSWGRAKKASERCDASLSCDSLTPRIKLRNEDK